MTSYQKQIFASARQKIASGWHQGVSYQNAQGIRCARQEAVSYCLFGALEAATLELTGAYSFNIFWIGIEPIISKEIGTKRWAHWNDAEDRTKDDVLKALDNVLKGV